MTNNIIGNEVIKILNSKYAIPIKKYLISLTMLNDPLDQALFSGKLIGKEDITITLFVGHKSINITPNKSLPEDLNKFCNDLFSDLEILKDKINNQ